MDRVAIADAPLIAKTGAPKLVPNNGAAEPAPAPAPSSLRTQLQPQQAQEGRDDTIAAAAAAGGGSATAANGAFSSPSSPATPSLQLQQQQHASGWTMLSDAPSYYEITVGLRPAAKPLVHMDECLAIGLGPKKFPLQGSQPGCKSPSKACNTTII